MAVFSLGSPIVTDVTYNFDTPFDVIVGGANSAFGGSSVVEQDENILSGIEGNGSIMFLGTYSSIRFTVPTNESWHGFTIGVQPIPVPAAVWLFGSGLLGLIGIARISELLNRFADGPTGSLSCEGYVHFCPRKLRCYQVAAASRTVPDLPEILSK
jgi:hypothetical protein